MDSEKDEARKSKTQMLTVFVEHSMGSDSSKDGNGKAYGPQAPLGHHHCSEQCGEKSVCELER